MLCPECGKENKDDASLCTQCGSTLNKREAKVVKKSSRKKLWILLAIAGIIVVILVLVGVCVSSLHLAPLVETEDATDIAADSATLNGTLSSLGTSKSVDVSFQWGTSSGSYPNETEVATVTRKGAFDFGMTGLSSNTTYYYRAKAVGYGKAYGKENSLTTLSP